MSTCGGGYIYCWSRRGIICGLGRVHLLDGMVQVQDGGEASQCGIAASKERGVS